MKDQKLVELPETSTLTKNVIKIQALDTEIIRPKTNSILKPTNKKIILKAKISNVNNHLKTPPRLKILSKILKIKIINLKLNTSSRSNTRR